MTLVFCDMPISPDEYVASPNNSRQNRFGVAAGMLHDCTDAARAGVTSPTAELRVADQVGEPERLEKVRFTVESSSEV